MSNFWHLKLADGRQLLRIGRKNGKRQQFYDKKDRFKMADGVITQKKCPSCNDWLPVSDFGILSSKNGSQSLRHMCIPCQRLSFGVWQRKKLQKEGRGSRTDPNNPQSYLKYRIIIGGDGLERLKCSRCKEIKLLIDFEKISGKYRARCKKCHVKMNIEYRKNNSKKIKSDKSRDNSIWNYKNAVVFFSPKNK